MEEGQCLSNELLFTSCAMVIPALMGMAFGNMVRSKINEVLFRKLFFVSLSFRWNPHVSSFRK